MSSDCLTRNLVSPFGEGYKDGFGMEPELQMFPHSFLLYNGALFFPRATTRAAVCVRLGGPASDVYCVVRTSRCVRGDRK